MHYEACVFRCIKGSVIACRHRTRGAEVMGFQKDVYNWISRTILGGSRSSAEVKCFVERAVLGSARQYSNLAAVAAVAPPAPSDASPSTNPVDEFLDQFALGEDDEADAEDDDDEAMASSEVVVTV